MKFHTTLALASFLALPSRLLAEEPSSGTLIMISSIGAWVLAAAAFVGIRRFRRARQQQRD
jgi:hypothetical protein